MRAIFADSPGLIPQEAPDPTPNPAEIVIELAAAGVNRADLLQVAGHYPTGDVRPILGLEGAGTVIATGDGVDPAMVGRRVSALLGGGGYAERVAVPVTQVRILPDDTDFIQAAARPEAMSTAWYNLVYLAGLSEGERVLIHGGSGGVGHVAIQMARALGAKVLTTCGSPEKAERCRDLGAHVAIDYHDDVVAQVLEATDGHGVDVILDVLGAGGLASNLEMIARGGRIAVIGLQKGRKGELDFVALMRKRALIVGSMLRQATGKEKAAIVSGASLFSGDVTAHVDAVVPFDEAQRAHELMNDPATFGKIVLQL